MLEPGLEMLEPWWIKLLLIYIYIYMYTHICATSAKPFVAEWTVCELACRGHFWDFDWAADPHFDGKHPRRWFRNLLHLELHQKSCYWMAEVFLPKRTPRWTNNLEILNFCQICNPSSWTIKHNNPVAVCKCRIIMNCQVNLVWVHFERADHLSTLPINPKPGEKTDWCIWVT